MVRFKNIQFNVPVGHIMIQAILLTIKRKQIIRDQNWFRAEYELHQENIFQDEALN